MECTCSEQAVTLCPYCQSFEGRDEAEVFVDPYCSWCGQHEEHHDPEFCQMIRDHNDDRPVRDLEIMIADSIAAGERFNIRKEVHSVNSIFDRMRALAQDTAKVERLGLDTDPVYGACPLYEDEDEYLCCAFCEQPLEVCLCNIPWASRAAFEKGA